MNSRVLLLVSLVLLIGASVLGYLAYQTTADAKAEALAAQKRAEGQANEGKTAMVVLARAVRGFQVLVPEDLTVEMVKHPLPGTSQSVEGLVGRTVMTDLPAGTALNDTHFNPGGQVARLLRAGERAVAIPVNDVVGGGGFLQPGDVVDIVLYLAAEEGRRASTQLVMRGVRVLSFGSSLIDVAPDVSGKEKDEQQKDAGRRLREARTAVLAVASADVSRLMLANSLGELRLSIVPTEELRQQLDSPGMVALSGSASPKSEALPVVDVVPTPSRQSAVPAQRYFLTDNALQLQGMPRSSGATSAPARARARTGVDLGSSVVIIRGLSTESK